MLPASIISICGELSVERRCGTDFTSRQRDTPPMDEICTLPIPAFLFVTGNDLINAISKIIAQAIRSAQKQ